jgi:hypothetical protein
MYENPHSLRIGQILGFKNSSASSVQAGAFGGTRLPVCLSLPYRLLLWVSSVQTLVSKLHLNVRT